MAFLPRAKPSQKVFKTPVNLAPYLKFAYTSWTCSLRRRKYQAHKPVGYFLSLAVKTDKKAHRNVNGDSWC